MIKHTVLGLMSGSSLDGLDLAVCNFYFDNGHLSSWELEHAETIPLPFFIKELLYDPLSLAFRQMDLLEQDLSQFFIDATLAIIKNYPNIELIGSHGHTIQHLPQQKISRQLGKINMMSKAIGLPVVGDFRQEDLQAGGVGTPMAPLADRDLFPGYDFYLNLGGIANISYKQNEIWQAFDLAPTNQVLNYFASKEGLEYDKDGDLAEEGNLSAELLQFLLNHPYIIKEHPKSLDNDEVKQEWSLRMEAFNLSAPDQLYTFTEFLSLQLQKTFAQAGKDKGSILLSGGGTHNKHLIQQFKFHNPTIDFICPEDKTIDFKEAALIAYAALLKKMGKPNFIASVTGASHNVIGGTLSRP